MTAKSEFAPESTVSKPAPYGYRWQEGRLAPDELEAPVRKLIYESFLQHRRKKTVARLLNEAGYRTRSGALFSDTAINRILRDGSAAGVYSFSQNGKLREIKIEPLVSLEVWNEVNAILNEKLRLGKKTVQLFAGRVFCGECDSGEKMRVPSNSPKYVCPNCRHKIGTRDLEEIFRSRLADFPLADFEERDDGGGGGGNQSDDHSDPATLADLWLDLTEEEKRELAEGLLGSITIQKREVSIRFACARASLETAALGQQQGFLATERQIEKVNPPIVKTKPEADVSPSAAQSPSDSNSPPLALTEPLLNEAEAARFLGISRMTLLRKRKAGEIKYFRVGFRVLYSKEKHLLPFLHGCEKENRGV